MGAVVVLHTVLLLNINFQGNVSQTVVLFKKIFIPFM